MEMERKVVPFELTKFDFEGRTMEGYAATFGNVDLVGDIIHAGAFTKTLAERGDKVKFLWQHNPSEPIGKPLRMHEDERGLFVKAVISDTSRGRDALALLKDDAIGELSIGYDAIKGGTGYTTMDDGTEVRDLRELKLYEFSLVSFPANEQAVVTALKQDGDNDEPSDAKPYNVFPIDDQFCVYRIDENGNRQGESLGCHPTRAEAQSQMDALYAAEEDSKNAGEDTDTDDVDTDDTDKSLDWEQVQSKFTEYYKANGITTGPTDEQTKAAVAYAITELTTELEAEAQKAGRALSSANVNRLNSIVSALVAFLEDNVAGFGEEPEESGKSIHYHFTINVGGDSVTMIRDDETKNDELGAEEKETESPQDDVTEPVTEPEAGPEDAKADAPPTSEEIELQLGILEAELLLLEV